MACRYKFDIPVDPIALMQLVQKIIEEHGGSVSGEPPEVSVKIPTLVGEVSGKCRLVSESSVDITITRKPFFVTCEMVRERLAYYLSEAVTLYNQQQA
jgi:hypothetical protein